MDAYGGPSHLITNDLFLGVIVDPEDDGQEESNALGDDVDASDDDDDGVAVPASVTQGTIYVQAVNVVNRTDQNATLYAFYDWNSDGAFSASETVKVTVPANTIGPVNMSIPVPSKDDVTLIDNPVGIRFRISTDSTLDANGLASDGEVEDYVRSGFRILSVSLG